MLETIREGSQSVWAKAILGLVIVSFVFAGVGSYISSNVGTVAASVNGDEIGQQVVERAYQNERARMESQFGEAFSTLAANPEYMAQFRQGILDRLIGEKLLDQQAASMGLRVSDEQVKQALVQMPEFQIGGQFNNDQYQRLLRQVGYQPNEFRDYLRTEMTRQQLTRAILGSAFALPGEAKLLHDLQKQTRDLRYLEVSAASFVSEINITPEQVTDYYQENLDSFDTQEQVAIAYVELKIADLLDSIEVSEADAQEYYQENLTAYQQQAERKVSHIFIEFADDKVAAQAKAQSLLDQLRAGADFVELAAAESQDLFSAENGGDLDWITPGTLDPAFEQAAFALNNVGQVSEVVASEDGYHIIMLTDKKEQLTTPFAEAQEQILAELKQELAEEQFYELQQSAADLAFAESDNLDGVAEQLGQGVKQTVLFARDAAPALVDYPQVLAAAFSAELIEDQVNSEVLELGNGHIMLVRIAEHQPQRTRSLEEVSAQITDTLKAQQSQQAARDWTENLLTALNEGQDISAQLAEKSVQWQAQQAAGRYAAQVPAQVSESLFSLSPKQGENTEVVDLTNGNVALVQLVKINPVDQASEEEITSLQQRLGNTYAQSALTELIDALKAEAEIEVFN